MSNYSRREFLESGAVLSAALGVGVTGRAFTGAPATQESRGPGPDMAVVNARVFTVDDNQPQAEAFALKNGRVIAVGSTDDIRNLLTPDTQVIDAGGMTVTPGFIDAHSHPSGVRELTGVNVNLRTIAEIQAALRKKAATTPPEYWVSGYMYDDTKLRGGRPVSRRDLDEAVPDHPAMVGHRGGHTGVYNSKAFELAGITADTPDPEGGKVYREDGELAG